MHVHMTDRDGNYLEQPEVGDVHGWTVMYQTVACDHVHRVLGWVGDQPSAIKVSSVAAAMYHPLMRAIPTPAPTSESLAGRTGVITDVPPEVAARIHAGEKLTPAELFDLGATGYVMEDEVMPPSIMAAARVVELMDAKGIDVVTLLTDSGIHNGLRALIRAGGEEMWEKVAAEFPTPDDDSIPGGH